MSTATTGENLDKSYAPASAEDPVRKRWDLAGIFHADPLRTTRDGVEPYSILIPPPNVTAALHLGHALNNTLQDVLIRHHRMRGCNTLWMPGTDHAGIATQTVVEKRLLQQEGKRRTDFEREAFIARVQAWKDEYEATITEQLKTLGASCDWARQRFTMDEICARAVREAFFRLFADDLIERGKRLVNWDPVTRTALADDEVEMVEVAGHMWYLRYPLADGDGHVTVATTRPETMLGDTAVAVNPADPRAPGLVGRTVRLPIVGREIPIVADDYVVMPGDGDDPKAAFATGFLKVTPAHDPNDWDIGLRHDLPAINVLAPDGTISSAHGWEDVSDEARPLLGLSREDARAAVVRWFEEHDLLEAVRDYAHSVGHSYRSHVPIEPYLSDQWYVRVTDDRLAGEALRALAADQYDGAPPPRDGGARPGDGGLAFFPARYARTFQSWHENLRDWCISRQLWWGHRIPVWSLEGPVLDGKMRERWERIAKENPDRCALHMTADHAHLCLASGTDDLEQQAEADGFARDPDVLDTWFSSALWPLNTMGWPDPARFPETAGLLEAFNPTSVLCTGRDIITLWVSRMVMFNRYFRGGTLPFRHVYINPMIQDGHGQRMSKSLGNGVDPRDIIHSHGADALRFVLCQIATGTQDVRLPVDMLCPACGHAFHPTEITTPAGHRVAAPRPECPDCGATMTSGYGAASGAATPDGTAPLARNTSSKFDEGRNFCNKLWNAARFALGRLGPAEPGADESGELALVDRWIISRLHRTLHAVEDALAGYQFNVCTDALYEFVWGDFCDWYLEAVKPTLAERPAQRRVLRTVLDATLRLLHPICPFVTETIWPHVRSTGETGLDGIELGPAELLAAAPWPDIACRIDDDDAVVAFGRVQALVEAIRAARASVGVPPKSRLTLAAGDPVRELVAPAEAVVLALAGLDAVEAAPRERPAGAVPVPFEGGEVLLLGLAGAVDLDAERDRLRRLVEQKERAVDGFRRRLDNADYVAKAPAAVVDETRTKLTEAEAELTAARAALDGLG